MKLLEQFEEIKEYEIHEYDSFEEASSFVVCMRNEGWFLYSTQSNGLEIVYTRTKINKFEGDKDNG